MIIRVEDYGAHGNGVIDDTNSLQVAFDDVQSPEDEVRFKAGKTYLFSKQLKIKTCNINGNGARLKPFPGVTFDCWWSDDSAYRSVFLPYEGANPLIHGFYLDGDDRVEVGIHGTN